jgi:hypothetical protein
VIQSEGADSSRTLREDHGVTVAAILACEMIEDETLLALERALPPERRPPLVWVEASLHERPQKLQAALQELVDRLDEGARSCQPITVKSLRLGDEPAAERIIEAEVEPEGDLILGFGYCGGGLSELVSHERRLIFPRADDCISIFLDGGHDRGIAARDAHAYYLTKGWFCHQGTMRDSFTDWVERYGEERAKHIRDMVFVNYERVSLIETGAFDVDEWLPFSKQRAHELELDHCVVPGSVTLLERLFAGDWDTPDIMVLEPGEPASVKMLFTENG